MMAPRNRSAGFTILELLIATAVFSVVLLVLSGAIIQMGRIYGKGVNQAQTQEASRNLIEAIGQGIQLNPGQLAYGASLTSATDPKSRAICINDHQYSFKVGQQQEGARHAVVMRTIAGGCLGVRAQDLTHGTVASDSVELLGPHMRLLRLDIVEAPVGSGTYRLTARVAYGDNDLLCGGSVSCTDERAALTDDQIAATADVRCKDIRSGSQFCAVSELSTMVGRRL